MNGMIMIIPAGGAVRVSRERRLMNDATSAAGSKLLSGSATSPSWRFSHLRRGEKGIEQSKESCAILDMEDVSIKQ